MLHEVCGLHFLHSFHVQVFPFSTCLLLYHYFFYWSGTTPPMKRPLVYSNLQRYRAIVSAAKLAQIHCAAMCNFESAVCVSERVSYNSSSSASACRRKPTDIRGNGQCIHGCGRLFCPFLDYIALNLDTLGVCSLWQEYSIYYDVADPPEIRQQLIREGD